MTDYQIEVLHVMAVGGIVFSTAFIIVHCIALYLDRDNNTGR